METAILYASLAFVGAFLGVFGWHLHSGADLGINAFREAETWLKATYGGLMAGAVVFLGAGIVQKFLL